MNIVTLILVNVSNNSHDTLIVLADGEVIVQLCRTVAINQTKAAT